jgi:hypothetical protein
MSLQHSLLHDRSAELLWFWIVSYLIDSHVVLLSYLSTWNVHRLKHGLTIKLQLFYSIYTIHTMVPIYTFRLVPGFQGMGILEGMKFGGAQWNLLNFFCILLDLSQSSLKHRGLLSLFLLLDIVKGNRPLVESSNTCATTSNRPFPLMSEISIHICLDKNFITAWKSNYLQN